MKMDYLTTSHFRTTGTYMCY